MLQNYLDGKPPTDHETAEKLCRQSSEMEKRASDAERASIKYKQVEFMEMQNKEIEYEGIISGVTEWGFFVEIIETKCEGLVKVVDLQDDFYEYDPANYCLRGRSSKRIYTFGDKVTVKIKKTDIEKRTIDMSLVGQELLKATIRHNSHKQKSGRGHKQQGGNKKRGRR
jgi:ribonuclease R